MAFQGPGNLSRSAAAGGPLAPQYFHHPTPRELHAQAMHRLQIGVIGLASMLLLIGLANIIMDRARVRDAAEAGVSPAATAVPIGNGGAATSAGDPLADIGVVPDLPAGEDVPAGAGRPSAAAAGN